MDETVQGLLEDARQAVRGNMATAPDPEWALERLIAAVERLEKRVRMIEAAD